MTKAKKNNRSMLPVLLMHPHHNKRNNYEVSSAHCVNGYDMHDSNLTIRHVGPLPLDSSITLDAVVIVVGEQENFSLKPFLACSIDRGKSPIEEEEKSHKGRCILSVVPCDNRSAIVKPKKKAKSLPGSLVGLWSGHLSQTP